MVVQKNISLSDTLALFLAVVKTVPKGFGDGLKWRHTDKKCHPGRQ